MGPILTRRLRIRQFTELDLDAVGCVLDECFAPAPRCDRAEWLGWTVRNYRALAQLQQPPYGDYAITLVATGDLLGIIGLVPSFGPFETLPSLRSHLSRSDHFTAEIGLFWAIAPAHRRAGYASEAAAALAAFAFRELRAARLVATTEHSNAASIGVMRRLGMTIEKSPNMDPEWFQTVGILFNPDEGGELGRSHTGLVPP